MSIMDPKDLKGDNGKYLVLCLYAELCKSWQTPVFTLKEEAPGLISLRKLYIQYCTLDPSESLFAQEVFGDMVYWHKAREHPLLKPYIEDFRKVAEAKRKELAFTKIIQEIKEDGKNAFAAAKYIIDEPWKDKRKPTVRKNSKESTQEALSVFEDDLERLREDGLLQ